MIKKSLQDSPQFVAGDKTLLREILHPKNEGIELSFSLAHAQILPGARSEPHVLTKSSETYYILSGTGTGHIDGTAYDLAKDDLLLVPAGAEQWVQNTGSEPLVFLCVVSPPWSEAEEVVNPAEV